MLTSVLASRATNAASDPVLNFRQVCDGIYASGLPRAKDIAAMHASYGIRYVADLTRRPRPIVERACTRLGIEYCKMPCEYDERGVIDAAKSILEIPGPLLFHCFHGRDRTGHVARLIKRSRGRVVLCGVGRNLNRAYRTCEAFGVGNLALYRCNAMLSGNLYRARGRVHVEEIETLPNGNDVLALETSGGLRIQDVDFERIMTLIIGGESNGLPNEYRGRIARIEQTGKVSGLTVEAALSIGLYEWGR